LPGLELLLKPPGDSREIPPSIDEYEAGLSEFSAAVGGLELLLELEATADELEAAGSKPRAVASDIVLGANEIALATCEFAIVAGEIKRGLELEEAADS
jgi:hypothetical protein